MDTRTETARTQMIRQQVRAWDVLDPVVLDTLANVPREHFVPAAFRALAFADVAIPLGHGQVMMTPQVEGHLLQALAPGPADTVLEVGTGSGFVTACLATLGGRVHSLEIIDDLAGRARHAVSTAGHGNVEITVADAFDHRPAAPYDASAITGSLPRHDARFEQMLGIGGRLFVIIGEAPLMQAWRVTRRSEGDFERRMLFSTQVPPLINATRPDHFRF